MHLLPTQARSLDDEAQALDLGRSPADVVMLSFSDSDLAVAAAAWDEGRAALPSLRLVSLAKLRHPYSVDLFIEKTVRHARFVLVRLLGGLDYWRYGVEELAAAAKQQGFGLAVLPGCHEPDARLAALSTCGAADLASLKIYFEAGGVANMAQALRLVSGLAGRPLPVRPVVPVPAAGLFEAGCRAIRDGGPHALILFYRAVLLAADAAPVHALADALAARGARVSAFFVASLKDDASADALSAWLDREPVDVILNTTAFSAQRPTGRVTDRADAPVLQVVLSTAGHDAWAADPRGLGAADLAMNVVLPEVDGRLIGGVASFKAEATVSPDLEFARVAHRPEPGRIARVAERALAWAALRRLPRAERRIACIVSDYPGKGGRAGQAVGLDTPASVAAMAEHLAGLGFDCAGLPPATTLMATLTEAQPQPSLPLARYRALLADLPARFVDEVGRAWGDPADDAACQDGAFAFRVCRAGKLLVAVQPDRGAAATRRVDYHDTALPPCHGYVAFYLWLREAERLHAMIHMGTHGTLEWLPGKAVALSEDCAPDVLVGALPVIYPFIVNNPGEAAQAKRRIGALTLGHLTPPLVAAGLHGDTAELEQLLDEYAEATALDGRRARLLAAAILEKAEAAGLLRGLAPDPAAGSDTVLASLDAWLCDLKEARIGDGLHVFGVAPAGLEPDDPRPACAEAERDALMAALDGRFVPPGPSGTPWAGRADVLPTGRNIFAVDPRALPTRTGWDIGARMAEELVTRHAQDHGEWPRRVVLDLWGSATMRTGGQDLAQAMALLGVKPVWDPASGRVTGFEMLPLARLGRSRVDATLRISGLFRDTFPAQIALFDAAVRAVAALDEAVEDNPLREGGGLTRIFGAAPGHYGAGLGAMLAADDWDGRDALGEAYLAATTHGFGRGGDGAFDAAGFRERVGTADAFAHTGDLPGQDLLDADVFAEHEGGFAAAAALLGAAPALYRADTTVPDRPRLRSLAEAVDHALLSRAANPRWIAGQMRHGWQGAATMADTLDALFAYAATTEAVPSRHFDRLFDATLGDEAVRTFLRDANPAATRGMAARYRSALRRGFWQCRRNSTLAVLAELEAEAA
ncbi:cobaltochelatase subunit CobN [Lichenihabitans sp. Uapishka_5]|uniref:cobaltochelatase subunit CobN n=1 Tax=Lichenihabitans sp. Uapishka_5 TaxID=3037302 RepID=UPI0029E80801|nr:cobaltochelatase subunit CobN [Lichenihabitans sp. Uapishka_5]MDX7953557.1 cobaltochelatase subunit CobN [Lichenihabitans sp. Uapishka_5]